MDKKTLTSYGWIVVCTLVLSIIISFATPFASFISEGVKSVASGIFDTNREAMGAVGSGIPDQEFEGAYTGAECPHEDVETVYYKDPTCSVAGYTGDKVCKNCKEIVEKGASINKLPHTTVIDKAVEATCTSTGLTEGSHCSVCDAVIVKQNTVSAKGHTKQTIPAVEATCTNTGLTAGVKCSVCGDILTAQTTVALKAHATVIDKAVAPTCVKTGLTEGTHCSVCNSVLTEQQVVAATGHKYNSGVITTATTCTKDGVKTYTCTNSGCLHSFTEAVSATGHTPTTLAYKAPTCTETGLEAGSKCSVCNTILTAQNTIEATGHDYSSTITTSVTCTTKGIRMYTCKTCSYEYTEAIDALGHTPETLNAVEPTCIATGLTQGERCIFCGAIIKAQTIISAQGHSYDNGITTTVATCTTDGVRTYTCINSGCSYSYDEPIAMLAHSEIVIEGYVATCTTSGLAAKISCSVCGTIIKTHEPIPATGHSEATVATVAPTCTTTGLTVGTMCSICGTVLKKQTVIKALGHSYSNEIITVTPTCTTTGEKTFTCDRCGNYYIETIDATGHTIQSLPAITPTCDEVGMTAGEACAVCNTVFVAQTTINAQGHAFDNAEDMTCNRCGITFTAYAFKPSDYDSKMGTTTSTDAHVDIPATFVYSRYAQKTYYKVTSIASYAFSSAQNLVSVSFPEGITIIGNNAFKECYALTDIDFSRCINLVELDTACFTECRSLKGVDLSECTSLTTLGSSVFEDCFVLSDAILPNSLTTVEGWVFYSCSNLTTIKYTGTPEEWGKISISSYAYKFVSETTGATIIYNYDKVLDIEGHTKCVSITLPAVAPTCINVGLTAGEKCSICNAILVTQTTIEKLGHTYNNGTITTYATCTTDGTKTFACIRCDNQYTEVVPATGHTYDEGAMTTVPTCNTTGVKTFTCINEGCNDSYTYPVAATGHTYADNSYICTGCGYENIVDYALTASDYKTKTGIDITSGNITIPETFKAIDGTWYKVTSIGHGAFYECAELTSIILPNTITSIDYAAFQSCTSLATINLPKKLTSIGSQAFGYCESLISITIPKDVASINANTFYSCTSLANISLPAKLTNIDSQAFAYCTALTSIDIPADVANIGEHAFYTCSSLSSITLPNGLTTISGGMFYDCISLASIDIPSSITTIGNYAFRGCTALTNIDLSTCTQLTSLNYASFNGCESLVKAIVPDSLTSIGDYAFDGCTSLEAINLHDGITVIGQSAFNSCQSLTSIHIPANLTTISDYVFLNCDSLVSIDIHEKITSIGASSFRLCTALTAINVDENNPYYCSVDGILYNKDMTLLHTVPLGYINVLHKTYTVPNSVTTIGDYVFSGWIEGFTSIDLSSCINLTNIGDYAFYFCIDLATVYLPDSITNIGDNAFLNCDSLITINYAGTTEDWSAITIGSDNDCLTTATINYNYVK